MKHSRTIIILGIVVTVVPFLGFPSSWKTVIFAVLGVAIAAFGYRMFLHSRVEIHERQADSYAQSSISIQRVGHRA